jgi:chaperonin GroES
MRIEPLGDQVVVKRTEPDAQTAGGIYLPDSSQQRPQSGKVLSVGAGKFNRNGKRIPPQINEGDRVLFSAYAGTEIEVNGEPVLIMAESDILAIID